MHSHLQVAVLIIFVSGCHSKPKPNIVVILADDLGWNDVSFHGSNQILTPNIDALAYNGIILNQHYVPALCTPSRASLLTGKYPTSLGMQHLVILASEPWGLPLSETLLPQHLKNNGYSTHAIGKWHLGFFRKEYTPTFRGFDTHFGYWNGYQDYYDHTMEATDGEVEPISGYDMRRGMDLDYSTRGNYATDLYTEEAVNIIDKHNSSAGPLFLYLAHLAPHAGNTDKPYQAPDEEVAKHIHITDPERRVYAAMISKMDEGVGKVMAALRTNGMLDNTIVLFMSDNGAVTFGAHSNHGSNYPLRGLKESPWEGGVRGVAAIWSPLLNQTRRVSQQLIHMSDWAPTLMSAAGLNPQQLGDIDGMDMWATISDNLPSPRTEVFNNYDEIENYSSLRVGEWKYVTGTAQDGEVDSWYGDSGEEFSQLKYRTDKVLASKTSTAIIGYLTDKQLEVYGTSHKISDIITPEEMLHMRKQTLLTCRHKTSKKTFQNATSVVSRLRRSLVRGDDDEDILGTLLAPQHEAITLPDTFECNPIGSECLFNLEMDPCERVNLAKVFPQVLEILQERVSQLKKTVAKPLNTPGVPFAHPKHHNNTWTNWEDAEESDVTNKVSILTIILDNILIRIVFTPVQSLIQYLEQFFLQLARTLFYLIVLVVIAIVSFFVLSSRKNSLLAGHNDISLVNGAKISSQKSRGCDS